MVTGGWITQADRARWQQQAAAELAAILAAPGHAGDRVDRHRVRRSPVRPGSRPRRGQARAVRGMAAGAGAGRCHREPRPEAGRLFTCTPAASAAASRSASPRPSSTTRRTAGERPGCRGCRAVPGSAGLLEKLIAAVRPEFRADILTFDPRDTVFGGPPCAVPGCERPARNRNMCWGHRQRWLQAGKPDLAVFTATTSPEWSGHLPLPACEVPGCNYCQSGRGLCQMHHQQWRRAGRPGISAWRLALDYAPPSPPPGTCLVSYCERWAMRTSAFCWTHHKSWRRAGRPEASEFAAARADPGPGCEWIDVRCLPRQLRLEIQYVLQCRGDERQAPLRPVRVQRILRDLAATGAGSLLDRTEEEWAESGPRGAKAGGGRRFVLDARARIEQLAFGSGWDVEYPRDKWRLRNLGVQPGKTATIDFAPVSQPWLASLAKRWCRRRLSAGLSASDAGHGIRAIRRFSAFLAAHAPDGDDPASIGRPLLERYLADLSSSGLGPEHPPAARLGAERVLPGRPPARLGRRHAARRRGLLPRGLPQARPEAPQGGRRAHHGPGRGPRQPGPVGQPVLPAHHPHPDPLRPADHRRLQAPRRLRRHRRRRRSLPPLLQPQDAARSTRPDRRGTRRADRRPAAAHRRTLARRDPRAVPQAAGKPAPEPGPSAAAPTARPSTAGWQTATSATSTGSRST